MIDREDIPRSWLRVSLEEITLFQKGKKPFKLKNSNFVDALPYLDIKAFEENVIRQFADKSSSCLVDENDIVMVWDGARSGWVAKGMKGALGSTLGKFRSFILSKDYLFYFLYFQYQYINSNIKGTGIPHVNPLILWNILLPLAPLNEQNRIVSRIDELFSELENNEKNLLLAQKQLGIYKQSLLKFAFEGRLTEQWRKENKPESVEKLLERIKRDKIARYEEEMKVWKIAVNKWEEEGKKGKKPMKPVSPVQDIPLEQFETNAFPEIPVEWKWIRNSDLLYYVTSGSRDWKKYYSKQGAYFIRTQDIKTNILELDQAAFVDLPDKVEGKRSLVEKGDLLMTITGANVGKVAYIDKNIPEAYVSQSVALMKFVDVGITPYLHLYFQSNVFGGKMIGNLVYGLGRPVLSLENMKEVPVAICSIEEQEVIVSKVTAILMATDHLEEIIRQSINQLDVLRQSILKKAFEGRLVKQDPTDESASELLKRIQAEKKKYLEDQKTQKKTKSKKEKVMKEALSIEEVLRSTNKPMLAKEVWLQSKHSHNIEEFYAELRKIQDNIKEVKKGTESLLSLIK